MEKKVGSDQTGQSEFVRQSENDTHDIEGTETVHATVLKRSEDRSCKRITTVEKQETLLCSLD